MKNFFLSVGLALALGGVAQAQTPPEVLKPYKAYRVAVKSGNVDLARKHAYAAWQKAEKLLGEHKTTGDLAANFADIGQSRTSSNNIKDRMKAYGRAIELSNLHNIDAIDLELERHIKRLEAGISTVKIKRNRTVPVGDYKNFADMEKALETYDRKGGVFEGDMEVLRLKHHRLTNDWEAGLAAAHRAELIFKTASKDIPSPYRSVLPLYLGDLYNDMGEPIKAALEYQKNFNAEKDSSGQSGIAKQAQSSWLRNWYKIETSGRLQEATVQGLCDCTPKEGADGRPVAIIQTPPFFAPRAERSGRVFLQFDLSDSGKPINIKVVASTERLFEDSALKGASEWLYSSASNTSNLQARESVFARIEYQLSNGRGKRITSKPLKTFIDYPSGAEGLNEEAAIIVTGSRIVRRN